MAVQLKVVVDSEGLQEMCVICHAWTVLMSFIKNFLQTKQTPENYHYLLIGSSAFTYGNLKIL